MSKIEIKLQFPMLFLHSMSIAQQLIPIYNTTVHKNKSYVALNVANVFVPQVKDTNMPQGWLNPDGIAINFLLYNFLFVSGIFNLILYPK